MYKYAALDPRPVGREANDALFAAGPVYGVEVTVPALAERCAANLDPQHLGGDASTAAIAAALDWPLPPYGATLATVRPDADSIGAMAILALRREQLGVGYEGETLIDTVFHVGTTPVQGGPGMWERINAVAAADCEASGPWPGPRPVEDAPSLLRPTTTVEAMCFDHKLTMEQRVTRMRCWLLTGGFEGMDGYQEQAKADAEQALAALDVKVVGKIAVVVGNHRLAMSIGYRYAPIVVATNPAFRFAGGEPHVKHTVARWNTKTLPDMDWDGMLAALNAADPAVTETARWGGSTSIAGSPQGVASGLDTEQVAEIVAAHI